MNKKKSTRFTFTTNGIPDDIYEILYDKSKKRILTPYIVELIRESQNTQLVLEKLASLEVKIDGISSGVTIKKEENTKALELQELQEGSVVEANDVKSKMSEEDTREIDF